jgi:hypothetical protein
MFVCLLVFSFVLYAADGISQMIGILKAPTWLQGQP